jgi:cytochrome c-type biogenesis protein CcmH
LIPPLQSRGSLAHNASLRAAVGRFRARAGGAAIVARLAMLLALTCSLAPARAVEPGEMLADPALEARARHISQELRCLVCQNQSIDDSNAELARDLRVLVRERLAAGDSDAAVLAFVEARYGEFVLLRPRLSVHTALLWSAPVLLLLIATMVLLRRARARASARSTARSDAVPLSEAEQRRLDELLKKTDA